jgi:hypothetical protein
MKLASMLTEKLLASQQNHMNLNGMVIQAFSSAMIT